MREHLGGIIMDCCNIDDAVLPFRLFQGKVYFEKAKDFKKRFLEMLFFSVKVLAVHQFDSHGGKCLISNVILM